jgi:hypothetical protein
VSQNRYSIKLEVEEFFKGTANKELNVFSSASTCNPFGHDAEPGMVCLFFLGDNFEVGSYPNCLRGSSQEISESRDKLKKELIAAKNSQKEGPADERFACKADDECFDISYPCSGAVVNKAFADQAKKYYSLDNARKNCFSTKGEKAEAIPFKVFCQQQKCTKQGMNPKLGFS